MSLLTSNTVKILFSLILCSLFSAKVLASTLSVGTISENPIKDIRLFAPFAKYLSSKLEHAGITKHNIVVASSIKEMAEKLKKGDIDVYIDSPMVSLAVEELSGSTMLLRRWKKGTSSYKSIIFVRKDSNVKSLQDLKGHRIAFESTYSSSGYLLPQLAFHNNKLKLNLANRNKTTIPKNKVSYIFSNDDENTITWVIRKIVTAGAMSDRKFKQLAGKDKNTFRILHTTEAIPRHVVNIRPDMDKNISNSIKHVLLNMHKDPAGIKILNKFKKTKKFDEIPKDVLERLQSYKKPISTLLKE